MATYWENSCSFGLRYVSWYKYLIVSLVFSHLGFWNGNLFLIAPFPDLCLLIPLNRFLESINPCHRCTMYVFNDARKQLETVNTVRKNIGGVIFLQQESYGYYLAN